jgi:ankyrin repeat protein
MSCSWLNNNAEDEDDHSTPYLQNTSMHPIHQAAANNDLAKVSNLLDSGIDINSQDATLQTALHHAIRTNSSAMVHFLLSRDIDTSLRDWGNYDDPEGFTAIEYAACLDAIAAMEELIAHGEEVASSRAVFLAAREGHMDMLRLLFDNKPGKMFDACNQEAVAGALRVSAKNQNLEQIQFILGRLGDQLEPDTRRNFWQGALDHALLAVFSVDCCDGDGGSPHDVRKQQWDHAIKVIDVLIEAGASINASDGDSTRSTALHYAMHENAFPVKLIASLLQHGADPNARDASGRSPFFELLAHYQATEELVRLFTDAGAVVGPPTVDGLTPLHVVSRPDIASWLLASGADIAAVDNQGEIPLHKARSLGYLELLRVYLDAGSPTDARNSLGWTPFMQSQSASISRALLEHGADIHAATDQGITALHHAANLCDLELILFLLESGADIHARASRDEHICNPDGWVTTVIEGNTPLHLAIASTQGALSGQRLDVVSALLNRGADIEAREGTGRTPLLLAVSRAYGSSTESWIHNEKVVNHLLERGADRHAVDDAGKNAEQLMDDERYVFGETDKFERKSVFPRSLHEMNRGPGRGWRRRGGGRGELYVRGGMNWQIDPRM